MRRSTDRILTTHVGSLVRPPELLDVLRRHQRGEASAGWDAAVRRAVVDVVRRQVEAGIDVPSDGEYSKAGFTAYLNERLDGFEMRPPPPGQSRVLNRGRDRRAFADFYAEYDAQEGQPEGGDLAATCVREVRYRGQDALRRDLETLAAAARAAGVEEAFIPAAAPGTVELQRPNAYYPSEEDYLDAIADAMREEYRAIVEAGFVLQVDDPRVVVQYDLQDPAPSVDDYRAFAARRIAALDHALAGLPADRIRYHLCWGSWHGPHTTDISLADIVDLVLGVHAGAISLEAANPRHAHEWTVWRTVKLPPGKVLIPGVISHNTNAVEHPELVAQRIETFARLVGKENVIAGADCGFAQGAFYRRVHPSIMWAKLRALAEGARVASERLWPTRVPA
ncbi:MAG: cobalamin-independent methionine synthase II family protein [Chloroflexota bacterium]|nr:cobalamin-independent methionine synthase II family protein [Chloroflexota bacterium]MDE3100843.1 cobalamin-independent methionine synthase II family protein [Chloroflexota bacterium]